jgi:hypothetical protein
MADVHSEVFRGDSVIELFANDDDDPGKRRLAARLCG